MCSGRGIYDSASDGFTELLQCSLHFMPDASALYRIWSTNIGIPAAKSTDAAFKAV